MVTEVREPFVPSSARFSRARIEGRAVQARGTCLDTAPKEGAYSARTGIPVTV